MKLGINHMFTTRVFHDSDKVALLLSSENLVFA